MTEPAGTAARQKGRRSGFGPVVLLGLGSSALAAIASAKQWIGTGPGSTGTGDASLTALDEGTKYPLASAVSLLLLASWGVLLVTRGRVRRAFAAVATLAALGLVVTVVIGRSTLRLDRADSLAVSLGRSAGSAGWTGWFWATAVVAVLALVAGGLAVRLTPRWPEMGRRYDAPGTVEPTAAGSGAVDLDSERDIWIALDQGHDPTSER